MKIAVDKLVPDGQTDIVTLWVPVGGAKKEIPLAEIPLAV